VDALGINLSDVGMCLFAIANLPLGSEIHLEFLPPHGKERIRVCATVRHRAFYLYGVEFVDSEPLDGGWAEVGSVQQPAESE
jgi:hypothetical protein